MHRLVSIPQTAVELLIQEHNNHPDSAYPFPSPITVEIPPEFPGKPP